MIYKLPFKDWMELEGKKGAPVQQPQEMLKEEVKETSVPPRVAEAQPRSADGRRPSGR
jgi:hypothetical protein